MATLTLQLVAQGKLKLTDSVETYLPGAVPNGRRITVRMLLNHTSGLADYTDDPALIKQFFARPHQQWTRPQLLAAATKRKPTFAPGTAWAYSNTNYIAIGMILKKVTGQSPAKLVKDRIAGPLGLDHTYLVESTAETTGRGYAHGYLVTFGAPGATPRYTDVSDWNLSSANTAGAMVSTPEELSRFFSALLGGRLLPPAQLAQMRSTVPMPTRMGIRAGYGLGLMHLSTPCGTVWGHGGDTFGHHSTALFSRDGRRGTVADSSTQLDPRVTPGASAQAWAVAVSLADATAVCAMFGRSLPASAGAAAA